MLLRRTPRPPFFRAPRLTTSSTAGGSIFAEDPARSYETARIIWSAAVDPTVLTVSACAAGDGFFDLTGTSYVAAVDRRGHEHIAALGRTGLLRLDVVAGTVLAGAVALRVHLDCTTAIVPKLSALDRLLRFLGIHDPGRRPTRPDPRLARLVEALRVADALTDGASLSRIAAVLLGTQRAADAWPGDGDDIKSSVRRRVALARRLTSGGPTGVLQRKI